MDRSPDDNIKDSNRITSWTGALELVRERQRESLLRGSTALFRGQSSANWKLTSRMQRRITEYSSAVPKAISNEQDFRTLHRETLKEQYQKFRSKAWSLLSADERTPRNSLFMMQHHGFDTPLLDWTDDFVCSVFFALRGRDAGGTAAIYLFDPQSHNKRAVEIEGLLHVPEAQQGRSNTDFLYAYHPGWVNPPGHDELLPVAISPPITNVRMKAQCSSFLLCGDSSLPQEEQMPDSFTKVELIPEICEEAQIWMELAGGRPYRFFPDLEGLREEFNEAFRATLKLAREEYG